MLDTFNSARQRAIQAVERLETGSEDGYNEILVRKEEILEQISISKTITKKEIRLLEAETTGLVIGLLYKLPIVIIKSLSRQKR